MNTNGREFSGRGDGLGLPEPRHRLVNYFTDSESPRQA